MKIEIWKGYIKIEKNLGQVYENSNDIIYLNLEQDRE